MTIYRNLILFLLGALLYSCGQRNDPKSADTAKQAVAANDPKIDVYRQYIKTLDTISAPNATLAAKKYQELFSNSDTTINDQAYFIFEVFYHSLLLGLDEHFQAENNVDISARLAIDNPATYPPQMAKLYPTMKDNGFEFIEAEGTIEVSENRDFIAKWFYPSVSGTMKKYLEQVNKENKEGCDEDGALIISGTTLSDRAVWWEDFTAAYPHFVFINNAVQQKQYYLTCLLKGLSNTPILNYDSHKLTEFYRGAYAHLKTKYPSATVTKMVSPFYEALLVNDTAKACNIINGYETQKLLLW